MTSVDSVTEAAGCAGWNTSNATNGGTELYKLGGDGSVTLWADINPGSASSLPGKLTVFG